MAWLSSVALLIVVFFGTAFRYSPQFAVGAAVVLSWLFPAWLIWPLFPGSEDSIVATGIDVKTMVASLCLLIYCFLPGRTFPIRLVWCDYAMLALVAVHFVSDIVNDGFELMVLMRMYAEWYLPYVAGRVALQSWDNASRLWGVAAGVGIILSVAAIPEALADVNVFESLFGVRPEEGTNREAARWGLQRAYGPAMHPIYFGVMQLLLLGWAGYATMRAFKRRAAAYWVFAIIPLVAGICATGSRGPIMGIGLAVLAGTFCFLPKARIALACVFVGLTIAAFAFQEPILQRLEKWSGESKQEIVIDGEKHIQSSVRSRLNLLEVNKIALRRSGLLGFGTQATTGFPINVPVGPMEAEAIRKVRFIDNTYILLTLRFGYLGVTAFLVAAIISLGQFYWVGTRYQGESPQWLCHCVGSSCFAALLVLATVWMPHEIGFMLVWTFGLSSGLTLAHLQGKLGKSSATRR